MKLLAAILLSLGLIVPTAAFTTAPASPDHGTVLVKHRGKKHAGAKKGVKGAKGEKHRRGGAKAAHGSRQHKAG